jgi:hypothetical protein
VELFPVNSKIFKHNDYEVFNGADQLMNREEKQKVTRAHGAVVRTPAIRSIHLMINNGNTTGLVDKFLSTVAIS